ncbi:hypothetical protein FNH22_31340 [Fulvivirga sp. M361]|uniref:hypothetical protein n=1 Tax=Fulvivirga sp. M361 TaxID=2594266 RepID=UPI00117A6036|nr:hypothetical protein [Fulvivirga sp. M361]TRX45815.1 hypothetical protein FNH22_31340 [Fulvivirga sp. M361]
MLTYQYKIHTFQTYPYSIYLANGVLLYYHMIEVGLIGEGIDKALLQRYPILLNKMVRSDEVDTMIKTPTCLSMIGAFT